MLSDRTTRKFPLAAFALVGFGCALLWARANDPFVRQEFTLQTDRGQKVKGTVCLAKPVCPRPVVIYLHDAGESLARSGRHLRQLAELGLAAVGLEYCQTNQAEFDQQFAALLRFVARRPWAAPAAMVWFGYGLGGGRIASFALDHPGQQPQLAVIVAGSPPPNERTAQPVPTSDGAAAEPCPFLLVHGDDDEVYPVGECAALATRLRAHGHRVSLRILPGQGHGFGKDKDIVWRVLGEKAVAHFGRPAPPPQHGASHLYWGIPLFGVVAWFAPALWRWLRRPDPSGGGMSRASRWFTAFAGCVAFLALAQTTVHLVVPRLPVTAGSLRWARAWLVPATVRGDWDYLARDSAWAGKRVRELLEHVELAALQREQFYRGLEGAMYREFVLSPQMGTGEAADWGWRRMLWEAFHPRVRKQQTAIEAAEGVVRFLRERVTVTGGVGGHGGIRAAWRQGVTNGPGFEELYVAALRSVGIAARLGEHGRTEFWSGTEWMRAPRPLLEEELPGGWSRVGGEAPRLSRNDSD